MDAIDSRTLPGLLHFRLMGLGLPDHHNGFCTYCCFVHAGSSSELVTIHVPGPLLSSFISGDLYNLHSLKCLAAEQIPKDCHKQSQLLVQIAPKSSLQYSFSCR